MDGWFFEAWMKMAWTFNDCVLAGSAALAALIATTLWLVNVIDDFKSGRMDRGDWGFLPDGTITFAGRYHLCYFALQAWIIGMIIAVFSWRLWATDRALIIKMIGAMILYGGFVYRDAKKLGLSCMPAQSK